MTPEEQQAMIDNMARTIAGDDEFTHFWLQESAEALAPAFAKIAALETERDHRKGQASAMCKVANNLRDKITALEAENAALRQRLVVDDAMVERALKSFCSTLWAGCYVGMYLGMRAALEAALGEDKDNV